MVYCLFSYFQWLLIHRRKRLNFTAVKFHLTTTHCAQNWGLPRKKKLHEFFRCGHQKGSLVDKNHKESSKFSDIRLTFWHFFPFFLTRISTPWTGKKCSKGYVATIFITEYYYWRINFFFENQPTSGWDTAKFFLKKKAPTKWQKPNLKEIFEIVRMCFWFWKITTSKNQKLRFSNTTNHKLRLSNIILFHHFYQYLESVLLV